jgi:predicted alpha/beta-fold hydrolase
VARDIVSAHGRIVRSSFVPHPLLRSAHVQTLLPQFRPLPELALELERLELADGDFVMLGWCGPRDGPLAVLLHGLGGGFDSKYLRGTARRLVARGARCALLLMRGAGDEPNRLPQTYHQGASHDLREVIDTLAARAPRRAMVAAGWSLGANVLLKYLGEAGAATPLQCAAAACAPFRLEACALRLRRGISRVYQAHMMKQLKAMQRRRHAVMKLPIDLAAVERARDFFEYDDAATAPLNGFADARDYYARCESGAFLHAIEKPTLIVNALDDPFMTRDLIPRETDLAPAVTLELSERGGHVGFIAAGRFGVPKFWLDQHLADHLADRLSLAPAATA